MNKILIYCHHGPHTMKRNVIGALLFLALVGEVTVGAANGLFTPPGMVVLSLLYLFYFVLLDSIVSKYRLDNVGIVLVNFALYSVLITGLVHGEIADYVLKPENTLITSLIRVQCSFYPLFAFYLLRKFAPGNQSRTSVLKASVMFGVFIALLSSSENIGIRKLIETFQIAPSLAVLFSILGLTSIAIAIWFRKNKLQYKNSRFELWSWLLLAVSLVPGLPFFMILLVMMIVVSQVFLFRESFRNSSVA